MFKISGVQTRYFEFEAPDTQKVLHIEPPKLKTLRSLENTSKSKNPSIMDMAGQIAKVISKNREKRTVTAEMVVDWMDSDQLNAFIEAFLNWLNREKTNDPN